MTRPLRILHVVGLMDPTGGGAEMWLMDVFRRIDRSRFEFHFLIHTPERLPFHDEIEALGGHLHRVCRPISLWKHGREFRSAVRTGGPFDLCHAHVLYCGYALRLARLAGIPVRVAHGHSGSFSLGLSSAARYFLGWTNRWVSREATHGLACSRAAAEALFGAGWRTDPRWALHYCGIDLSRFRTPLTGPDLRRELGIPDGAFVIGHVGRFQREKNHEFLLRVACEAARREPRTHLLLVGDGPLRARIAEQAGALGLQARVTFTGVRTDAPALMRGAMDVLAFPSLFEGLGLVAVEAQAAGLPVVYSDVITDEIRGVPELLHPVPLTASAARWAEVVLTARRAVPPVTALARLDTEQFSIARSVEALEQFYAFVAPHRG